MNIVHSNKLKKLIIIYFNLFILLLMHFNEKEIEDINKDELIIKCYDKCPLLFFLSLSISIILLIIFYDFTTESTYFPSIVL